MPEKKKRTDIAGITIECGDYKIQRYLVNNLHKLAFQYGWFPYLAKSDKKYFLKKTGKPKKDVVMLWRKKKEPDVPTDFLPETDFYVFVPKHFFNDRISKKK